jgi:hypothetical protein
MIKIKLTSTELLAENTKTIKLRHLYLLKQTNGFLLIRDNLSDTSETWRSHVES